MSEKTHKIFIDDGGAGSMPVVFVHSLAGNTQQWSAQLSHFRTTRRAVALDLRGHGQSSSPTDGDYEMNTLAQDVHAVVEKLGIEKFILVGHSMGGGVAVSYAATYPQRVAGLLLVDPPGDSTQMPVEDVQQYIGAMESDAYLNIIEGYWNHILTGATETTQTQVMQDLRNTPKTTVVGASKALFNFNPVAALGRYHGPKLSVITPINETPFGLHKLVPDLPHVMITDTGHWLQMDKPEEFNQILDNFLTLVNSNTG